MVFVGSGCGWRLVHTYSLRLEGVVIRCMRAVGPTSVGDFVMLASLRDVSAFVTAADVALTEEIQRTEERRRFAMQSDFCRTLARFLDNLNVA